PPRLLLSTPTRRSSDLFLSRLPPTRPALTRTMKKNTADIPSRHRQKAQQLYLSAQPRVAAGVWEKPAYPSLSPLLHPAVHFHLSDRKSTRLNSSHVSIS